MPPEKNGDYAFLLHILKSMKSTGKAAVILPHGVLFRGNKEADIRKQLVKRGFIKGIIGLPANLFYGTGIPACVIVLDKENAQSRTGVFMVDASNGFLKDGNKNRLRSQDMHKIVDVFNKQQEIDRYSRIVPLDEISNANNEFNLNIPRYIDSSEHEDVQDLYAHIHGGVPNRDIDALSASWDAFPDLRRQLFIGNGQSGYCELTVNIAEVQQTILDSADFTRFYEKALAQVDKWYGAHRPALESISSDTKPSELISILGDELLAEFRNAPLLDEYDVYERLMTYWHGVMHDDVFLIMNEGWLKAALPRKTIEDKDRKISETPDLVIGSGRNTAKYKADLIPPALIVSRFFAEDQARIEDMTAAAEDATHQVEEYLEEHAVEDGLLAEAMDDGKISKALAMTRLKDAKREHAEPEEIITLKHLIDLYDKEAATKKLLRECQTKLDIATLTQYGHLSEIEIRELVLDDKWKTSITNGITGEVTKLTHNLVARIKQLGERYDATLGDLESEIEKLSSKVALHLAEMGLK